MAICSSQLFQNPAAIQASSVQQTVSFLQFVATLTTNIEKLSGPVNVAIVPGSIKSGSVVVGTTVAFLTGDTSSVAAYTTAMRSSSVSTIFGSYAASVNTASIAESTIANPGKSVSAHCCWKLDFDMLCLLTSEHTLIVAASGAGKASTSIVLSSGVGIAMALLFT